MEIGSLKTRWVQPSATLTPGARSCHFPTSSSHVTTNMGLTFYQHKPFSNHFNKLISRLTELPASFSFKDPGVSLICLLSCQNLAVLEIESRVTVGHW